MATFGYLRVSTSKKNDKKKSDKDQTTDNQKKLITDAGFNVDAWFSEEGVSGTIKATSREAFSQMLSIAKNGDTVICTALDRLGRNASDILQTIEILKKLEIKLRIMAFDGIDLTSSVGKMILTCMAAMAELERDMISERTVSGLARTKEQGTKLGRPFTIHPDLLAALCVEKEDGSTLDTLAFKYGIPRNTIARNISKWKDNMDGYASEYHARETQYEKKAA